MSILPQPRPYVRREVKRERFRLLFAQFSADSATRREGWPVNFNGPDPLPTAILQLVFRHRTLTGETDEDVPAAARQRVRMRDSGVATRAETAKSL